MPTYIQILAEEIINIWFIFGQFKCKVMMVVCDC